MKPLLTKFCKVSHTVHILFTAPIFVTIFDISQNYCHSKSPEPVFVYLLGSPGMPRNRFPAWQNRFPGFRNVYKYGLWPFSTRNSPPPPPPIPDHLFVGIWRSTHTKEPLYRKCSLKSYFYASSIYINSIQNCNTEHWAYVNTAQKLWDFKLSNNCRLQGKEYEVSKTKCNRSKKIYC